MKIKISDPDNKPLFTEVRILIMLVVTTLIITGVNASYTNFSNQVKEGEDENTRALIRAINMSDENDDVKAEILLNKAIAKVTENNIKLVNTTEQVANGIETTNNLTRFLSDNFGSDSGYLERENFQYQQANDTYDGVQELIQLLNKNSIK